MRAIVSISVEGLLGSFNHDILFPEEWEFVIIHGPNGVGKTKLFELIKATFFMDYDKLASIPFDVARFHFDDESELQIVRREMRGSDWSQPDTLFDTEEHFIDTLLAPVTRLNFQLLQPNKLAVDWTRQVDVEPKAYITHGDVNVQFNHAIQVDHITSRTEFASDRPSGILRGLTARTSKAARSRLERLRTPQELAEFLAATSVYVIETQRLLYVPNSEDANEQDPHTRTRVRYLAADLARRLSEVLAKNSEITQELDQTFPHRLFRQPAPPRNISDSSILMRYQEQTKLRDRLAAIGLTEAQADLPLPSNRLADWQRLVLWTYLQDSEDKLHSFLDILQRVELFRDIINARFLFKQIRIDRERGFVFRTHNEEEISADALSSGEQHELVLVYGLLFGVTPGTLVLIDEPEISLHPAWQRQFLSDIARISSLTSLRFIVATHSPQIIHKWWDRAIALTPQDEHDEY
ncbi:AAA family ATPase [Micromonospora sp. NPDC047812]|uniref:AAA family ATPase n=1 Tax=Micromonospora sp. NPDC047812 TaxID=3155742 RepID=UPI0034516DFA